MSSLYLVRTGLPLWSVLGHYVQLILYMAKTVQKGRDAKTGRFISIEEANRRPDTTVVEKLKVGPIKHRK